MNKGKTIIGLAAGLFSLFVFTNYAAADSRHHGRWNNGVRHEIRSNRTEYRNDLRELYKDKAELRRDLRNGASRAEIAQDRAEIRQDLRELYGDRRDLYQDRSPYRGYYSGNRSGWWNNNWWYGR